MITRAWRTGSTAVLALAVLVSSGCMIPRREPIVPAVSPHELEKITQPEYIIEPPDILQIDLISAVPKPPYKLQALDAVALKVTGTLPGEPIQGIFQIDTDGTLNLGSSYGTVQIAGKTVPEARVLLQDLLNKKLREPTLEFALAQSRGMQQVRGPHLVRPDGSVWFESYGAVRIVGMTLPQAQAAIEEHLGQFFLEPKVAMNITGYNSKVFYICIDSSYGGAGSVYRLPVTGNETVLDVMSQVGGMPPTADYHRIWIARPAPAGSCPQILPIDWKAITEKADVSTNYQLLAGDRLFVKSAPMVTIGARLDRVLQPIERLLGFYLLAQSVGQGGINGTNR